MAWKINFLHVFKFRPLFCNQWAWKPVKTTQHMKMPSCGHIQHHIWWFGTDFRLEIASSNHWNGLKNFFCLFSNFFYFLGSKWPNMVLNISTGRYFHVLSCFHRFLGLLVAKKWKKFDKTQKCWFSGHLHSVQGHFKVLEFDPRARFWCSLGPWWGFGICKVVSQCLLVFSRQ